MPSRFATNAVWLLRIVLVVQCTVQASMAVFDPLCVDSSAYDVMVNGLSVGERVASAWDDRAHMIALAAALALVCVPIFLKVVGRADRAGSDRWPWTVWQLPILLALVSWNVVLLLGESLAASGAIHIAVVAAAGVPRVAVPLALCILAFRGQAWSPRDPAVRGAMETLRVATVAAFAALAWQAVGFDPAMIDAVLGTAQNIFGWTLSEDVAKYLVCGVGIISAALAVFLLFFRWQGTAVAMAAIAAVWLLFGLGEGGLRSLHVVYPDAMLRIATVAAPCAILLLQLSRTATPHIEQDETSDDELVLVDVEAE